MNIGRGNWRNWIQEDMPYGRFLLAGAGGLLLFAGMKWAINARRGTGEQTQDQPLGETRQFDGKLERDVVEEASWESFPASDPPGW